MAKYIYATLHNTHVESYYHIVIQICHLVKRVLNYTYALRVKIIIEQLLLLPFRHHSNMTIRLVSSRWTRGTKSEPKPVNESK